MFMTLLVDTLSMWDQIVMLKLMKGQAHQKGWPQLEFKSINYNYVIITMNWWSLISLGRL